MVQSLIVGEEPLEHAIPPALYPSLSAMMQFLIVGEEPFSQSIPPPPKWLELPIILQFIMVGEEELQRIPLPVLAEKAQFTMIGEELSTQDKPTFMLSKILQLLIVGEEAFSQRIPLPIL
jgi:hypothetical protein